MNCREVTNALLIADPAELKGIGSTPVAQHVRGCDECRRRAELILAETEVLAAALAMVSQPQTAEPLIPAPHARLDQHRLDQHVPASVENQPTRMVRIPAAAWAALPLAAALASVLLVRDVQLRPDLQPPDLLSVRHPVSVPVVNAPADRDLAVIDTGDRITVVWYGNKSEGSQ